MVPEKKGFANTILTLLGKSSDTCDSVAGYISFVYTIVSGIVVLIIGIVAHIISKMIKGSIRIQTTIDSVAPDTHVLHEFPEIIITPRQETFSRRVKRANKYVTEYYTVTLYDVSNFVSPNGELMNTLTGLSARPLSSVFPVQLNNGGVDGGTVEKPSEYWNPCVTTLDHKGKKYENIKRFHNDNCSSLLSKEWDVYMQEDGSIKKNNVGAYGKVIAQIIVVLTKVQLIHDIGKLGLLVSNGFYSNYTLPDVFKSGQLGNAGKMYAKWWNRAYKADTGQKCLQAIGDVGSALGASFVDDVTNVAESVAGITETVTESAALAYLTLIANAKDVTNVDIYTSKIPATIIKIVAVRFIFLCLLLLIVFKILKAYMFTFILKVERGNDRPMIDYVMVAIGAMVMTFILRKYVYIAHSSSIRKKVKKKVLKQLGAGPQMEDFEARFYSIDYSRIAI